MSPTRILLESDEAAPLTTVSGPTPAPEPADSGGDSFFAQAWNGSTEWLSSLTALQMVRSAHSESNPTILNVSNTLMTVAACRSE
eukprot:scaffold1399_cov410-Prasinococcus_capsulatus_cf.AAC.11